MQSTYPIFLESVETISNKRESYKTLRINGSKITNIYRKVYYYNQ